jgi:dipeptidyl aminopeptidase/acylaminoacyl peptidase
MIWVTGGFPPGGIGESAWSPPDLENDQSAQQYRQAGMVMLYPTFRGCAGNPGFQETFFGEVDDILSALKYLNTVPYVDPNQFYLGGRSTGGTMVLLAAAGTRWPTTREAAARTSCVRP